MNSLWGQVIATVLWLTALGGMLTAFLLDTAIMPWAVAVIVSYALIRVESLHRKVCKLYEYFEIES